MSDGFPYADNVPGNFAYNPPVSQRPSDGSVEDTIERLRFLSREAGGNPLFDRAAKYLEGMIGG